MSGKAIKKYWENIPGEERGNRRGRRVPRTQSMHLLSNTVLLESDAWSMQDQLCAASGRDRCFPSLRSVCSLGITTPDTIGPVASGMSPGPRRVHAGAARLLFSPASAQHWALVPCPLSLPRNEQTPSANRHRAWEGTDKGWHGNLWALASTLPAGI